MSLSLQQAPMSLFHNCWKDSAGCPWQLLRRSRAPTYLPHSNWGRTVGLSFHRLPPRVRSYLPRFLRVHSLRCWRTGRYRDGCGISPAEEGPWVLQHYKRVSQHLHYLTTGSCLYCSVLLKLLLLQLIYI